MSALRRYTQHRGTEGTEGAEESEIRNWIIMESRLPLEVDPVGCRLDPTGASPPFILDGSETLKLEASIRDTKEKCSSFGDHRDSLI
jgi:hypothetical protein